jgi:hypothetical protein
LDRDLPKLDAKRLSPGEAEWRYPSSLTWGRPWTFNWDILYATRRLLKGLLEDLASQFDETTLATLFEQGRAQGLEPFVEVYFGKGEAISGLAASTVRNTIAVGIR